ncbi:MAG TPA: FAD-dependent oxidoreductase [Candidatus Limnocylindria bacterium]|nr:FAD-dependent oxidoreductase [Candidatus Limnocylindria bacterium]
MKIAVIGAGVSGLVAARLLYAEHEVTVFEEQGYIGGHTRTVDVDAEGRTFPVDTGFIVYNEETYPSFTRLLSMLGVATQPSTMSFSARCERTGTEYCPSNFRTLFAQRMNLLRPAFWRMLLDVDRFKRAMTELIRTEDDRPTLGEFIEAGGYSRMFSDLFLVPMASAIWSAAPGAALAMPALFFARFFDNHRFLDRAGQPLWRVVQGGSREYVAPLTEPFRDRIRLGTPVLSVRRRPDGVEVTPRGGPPESFDQAVLAVHSDQALAILSDPTDAEREILSSIRYQENRVVLHTDVSLLPRRRAAWASWNYLVPAAFEERVSVTYDMNILQSLPSPVEFLVTLNREEKVRPETVLLRTVSHHPVFTRQAVAAQARRAEISGVNRTWYCGAYWGNGFHEDGVRSAADVGRAFGAVL